MATVWKLDTLVISVQNIIPELTEYPINGVVLTLTAGVPALPDTEFTVSDKTITWNPIVAGYDLEVGEKVYVYY